MNNEDKLLNVYCMLSNYDMTDGYWYLHPSYNFIQLREGVCAQIRVTSIQQYCQLCSVIVPKLLQYKAPMAVMNPLRCYEIPSEGFGAVTIYSGDWNAQDFFNEIGKDTTCVNNGTYRLKIEDSSYIMKFSRYVDFHKLIQSNLLQTTSDYLSCIYC